MNEPSLGLQIAAGIRAARKEAAEDDDIVAWILKHKLKNEKGELFEFVNHHFLADILRDETPEQVTLKASQIGWSTSTFIKEAYYARKWNMTFIHTFPTLRMAADFVPMKVDTIIRVNPVLRSSVGNKAADSQRKKQFGLGWILWKGCQGETEGFMDTADVLVHDERDKSDDKTISDFDSRVMASKYRWRWEFSNPEMDGYGVSALWKASDQKHLFHQCSRCNHRFYQDFFTTTDIDAKEFICPGCGQPLREEDRATGAWVPKYPGRDVSGWWINHMMCPWIDAKKVVGDYLTKSEEYFFRSVLAMPPPGSDSRVTRDVILKNCVEATPDMKTIIAGVDQGKVIHVVIGNLDGIFKLLVLNDWDALDNVMRDYQVQTMVLDKKPDVEAAQTFAAKWPGRVFLNVELGDRKDVNTIYKYDEQGNRVQTNKHPMISQVLREFVSGGIKMYMPRDDTVLYGQGTKDYKSFCGQAETLYRTEDMDKNGTRKWVWQSTNGQDHFYLATCYWHIARQRYAEWDAQYGMEDLGKEKDSFEGGAYADPANDEDLWMSV
jgi:hypothetical protein